MSTIVNPSIPKLYKRLSTILAGPAIILFISANVANVANMAFNMIFARLMGPAAFADLTFLLTLKLGALCVLAAFQLSFSKFAAMHKNSARSEASSLIRQSLFYSVPIMMAAIILADSFARVFHFSDTKALIVLALVIPFFFPMIIFRGLAQGRIDLPRIVGSVQIEWIIRLFGAVLLWQLGFGLSGIALAVGLSIVAGMIFSIKRHDHSNDPTSPQQSEIPTRLLTATLPFFALQFSQVLILDGDILLAKAMFTDDKAGLAAGVMLVQRIFFFAFLSFSSLLLPLVSSKSKPAVISSGRTEFKRMLLAIILISSGALCVIALMPSLVISLILGSEFLELANIVIIAGLTGAVFTITHLCSVYMLALGDKKISWIILAVALVQIISLFTLIKIDADITLLHFFCAKLVLQIALALVVLWCALVYKRHEKSIK